MRPLYDGRRSPARLRRVEPRFFASPDAFRAWLEANHDSETEVMVGFHKKHTGRP